MSNAFDKASLVMLPHAYEEGKLYSLKPTDRSGDFTFSRGADTATRVGEDGYIKKEHSNLLLQSNSFDTTWGGAGFNLTPNQEGYDSSTNAWLMTSTATGSAVCRLAQGVSFSGVNTLSVYAKGGSVDFFGLRTNDGTTITWFELTGVGNVTGNGVIEPLDNDWYRCSVYVTGSHISYRIYIGSTFTSYDVAAGDSIYIQDAQINQGLVATPYLETTTAPVYGGLTDNMPRLDYTDATCPSLLLEPSRSNSATYSEYIDIWTGTGFNKNFGFTSPEGVNNAYEIRIDSAGGAPSNIGPQLQVAISASTQYTVSAFVKPLDTLSEIRIATFNDDAQRGGDFDFTNNTFTALNTGQETGEVIPFGDNGWYRVSLTYTSGTDVSVAYRVCFPNGTVRDGNTAFLLYGLQVEAGSYPTSYIPTYGSAQTRPVEDASNTNTIDADNDFTFYFESTLMPEGFTGIYFSGPFGYLSGYTIAGNNLRHRFGGTNYSFTAPEGVFKYLIRKDSTNMKFYLNGVLERTITTLPTGTNDLELLGGKVYKTLLFPTVLSDSECIALTTQA